MFESSTRGITQHNVCVCFVLFLFLFVLCVSVVKACKLNGLFAISGFIGGASGVFEGFQLVFFGQFSDNSPYDYSKKNFRKPHFKRA